MKELLKLASQHADEAEIFSYTTNSDSVSFENGKLKAINSNIQSGYSLRIIKDGKLGFAYTKNLNNRQELIDNALNSLKGGVEAPFSFPEPGELPQIKTFDQAIENVTSSQLVDECGRMCEEILKKCDKQVNAGASKGVGEIRIVNSKGVDYTKKMSSCGQSARVLFPGSYASVARMNFDFSFTRFPMHMIDYITETFNSAEKEATPGTGKMKVIFHPYSMYALMWRLKHGTNGKSIYMKESPLAEKIGEKLFSDKITIYDDPTDDAQPGARAFDDEGIVCRKFPLVENGILKNFYYDLNYSGKTQKNPTGHGYKGAMWGGEKASLKPGPSLSHLVIAPGDVSLSEMIKSVDKGIIVAGCLGAHSGNIPNGDLSIGLCPGFYIENGQIVGHVKDAMVAGNIYEMFKNVALVENECHPTGMGRFPHVLFENVSVATKE